MVEKAADRRQRNRGRAARARRQRVRLDRRRGGQLRHPRRVRRCRRHDDRHRRRLFGLGPGPQRRRERGGDRPLAEARSGQARQGRDRDQGRVHGRARAGDDRAGVRRVAASGSGSTRSTFITSTRTTRACRWPTASARSMQLREGGQDPRDRPVATSPPTAAATRRWTRAAPTGCSRRLPRCRPGTIWSSARSSRASCATPRSRNGLGIFPFYSLANGFLTGKYRSKDDLDKSPRGERSAEYLEGKGMRVLEALDEIAAETGARARDGRAGLDHGAAGDHRRARQRDERRAASAS